MAWGLLGQEARDRRKRAGTPGSRLLRTILTGKSRATRATRAIDWLSDNMYYTAMSLPPPLPVFLSVVSNASLLKRLLLPFVVICAALLIGACSQAVKSAEPDPDPEPTPKVQPTLLGTWQRVRIEQDDDGNEITQTTLLTFTATHYFDRTVVSESGVPFEGWDNAGTYTTTTATSMEKTFYIDDDDDGIAEESSVEKEFLFTGDSLLIHHWGSEHREQNYERFERLEGLPTTGATTLQGTWRRAGYWTTMSTARQERFSCSR